MKWLKFWTCPIQSNSGYDVFLQGFLLFCAVSGMGAVALLIPCLIMAIIRTPSAIPSTLFAFLGAMIGVTVCGITGGFLSFFTYGLLRRLPRKIGIFGSVVASVALTLLITFYPLGMAVIAFDESGWIPAIPLTLCLILMGRMGVKIHQMLILPGN